MISPWGASPVFKGPWPVPNKVTELPSLATGERCVRPKDSREAQEESGRTGWALGPGCLDPLPITHFLAREHSVGSLFGQVPEPQGLPPTPLSAYRKVPSGLLDSPTLHGFLFF